MESPTTSTTNFSISLEKLRHYGINGSENDLINSILSNRSQYVKINGSISDITPTNPCSVLEWSKLSSLLYILYCNEIPLLYRLVGSPIMNTLTNLPCHINLNNISHKIVQYVDDSTNIISCNNTQDIQLYINLYFSILEEFYDMNKISINADKSKLLIIVKPNLRQFSVNIKLKTNKYLIDQSKKI